MALAVYDPLDPATPWDRAWAPAAPLAFAGVGLHSGRDVRVVVRPGRGLALGRIPVSPSLVSGDTLSTTCGVGGDAVATVEHLLAALWGMGLGDATIESSGGEIPVMDGSALDFAREIARVGVTLGGERPTCALPSMALPGLTAAPGPGARIAYRIDFPAPIGVQSVAVSLDPTTFLRDIAPARTFCFAADVPAMQAAGLALGGTLENAVVFDPEGPRQALRFPDEPCRHKVLDLIGDMALTGVWWTGTITADRAGHRLHHQLARAVAARLPARSPI